MLTPTAQTPKGQHATSNHGLIEDKDKVEVLELDETRSQKQNIDAGFVDTISDASYIGKRQPETHLTQEAVLKKQKIEVKEQI